MSQQEITDNLDALLEVLPPKLAATLQSMNQEAKLLEVVLDLGRWPEARFTDQEATLSEEEVTQEEIDHVVSRIGAFGDDNRAGIPRTLHRISAIRNRKADVVGLTLRVGRAVYGTIDIIRDIVESGQSILLLGRPGVGKTTMLREVARVLSEKKRVVIVDTSNEIGGDGDIPHPAIGRARRMQVTTPTLQHEVMIEAVENHMPEVIIIDEIGRELEAVAARTIAERGVQLVATAHGNTLDNLMMNPTLADLVGGIQSVTLSDEEARRRGTQKSILERKAPPTFDAVIEIQDWYHLAVRHEVAEAVDAILRGREMPAELRYRDETGEVHVEKALLPREERGGFEPQPMRPLSPMRIYTYGVSQDYLQRASESLDLPVEVVRQLSQANLLLTTKNYYRRRSQLIQEAERRGIPTHVLRSNTAHQVKGCLTAVFGVEKRVDPFESAMQETQEAIAKVLAGVSAVELSPQRAYVRRKQHEMAQEANLLSQSKGREPRRRVTIYQEEGR